MDTFCTVSFPDIDRMTDVFDNLFDKAEKKRFTSRIKVINDRIKEHNRLVKELEKQRDKYFQAVSDQVKYSFSLEITINDFRVQFQRLQKLLCQNKMKSVKDELIKKIQKATETVKKYHSLMTEEVLSRLDIQVRTETLYVDVLFVLQEKTLLYSISCPSKFQVSCKKIVEKFSISHKVPIPPNVSDIFTKTMGS